CLEQLAVAESAEVHLPRLDVLDEVVIRVDGAAGLEHERLETVLGELLRRPATGNPRADDDRVEMRRLTHGRASRAVRNWPPSRQAAPNPRTVRASPRRGARPSTPARS